MRGRTRNSLALLLLLLLPALALAFDFSELENAVSEHTLDNGLKIIVLERHDAPVATFVTQVNVGGANDPKEYTGLAHMFEHMAFKGTKDLGTKDINQEMKLIAVEDSIFMELLAERKKGRLADSTRLANLETAYDDARDASFELVDPNAFSRTVEQDGGVGLNAGTSMDNTTYFMSLPSNRLELWMAMESERFLNPVLREMYKERDVIAEERRQTLESSPFGRLLDELRATAYKAHPYGISIVGHMSDIQNYTRAKALEYYKTYYVPANMTVVIVGDVKTKDVLKLVEKYWGRLPAAPMPEALATVEPEQKGERRVQLEDPSQPLFTAAWHIPEATHPDFPALEALSDYLGQGRTSEMYENLVKERKIAAQVGMYAGYPGAKDPSLAIAYAIPAADHSTQECETEIFAEVDKMKENLIPVEELEKIKARAKAQFIFGLSSNQGLAMQLASYQTYWGDWREAFRELDRINALTPEDVQRVAKQYFTKENRTVATMETIGS
ncbi:MAG: pitrilysin family protein [bacterium]